MTKRKVDISVRVTNWLGTSASLCLHTFLFFAIFSLYFLGVAFDTLLLILTTAVSLEAIYLAIFIQMTVNRHDLQLKEISKDTDDILADTEELTEDE